MDDGDLYDFSEELRGTEVNQASTRDPVAVAGIALSLIIQVATWVWWGGRLEERVSQTEKALAAMDLREREGSAKDTKQDISIAVIGEQLAAIRSTVDRIEARLREQKDPER